MYHDLRFLTSPLTQYNPPHSACAGEVNEAALVRDILYVFQGIDGKFIKMSAQDNCYKIDSKVPKLASSFVKALNRPISSAGYTHFIE